MFVAVMLPAVVPIAILVYQHSTHLLYNAKTSRGNIYEQHHNSEARSYVRMCSYLEKSLC